MYGLILLPPSRMLYIYISATVPSGHMVRVPKHLAPQAPSKAEPLVE